MPTALDPFRFLLIALAGWMNQRQLHVIEYLPKRTASFANNSVIDGYGSMMTSAGVWPPKPEDLGERCWRSLPQS
jgi:hypothetical protein